MDDEPEKKPEAKPLGADLIIPVAAVAFSIYYFTTIVDVPWTAQVSAVFVGTILIILCLVYIGKTLLSVYRGEATLGLSRLTQPHNFVAKRVVLLGLTIAYIVVIDWAGFTLTTFFFLVAAMLLLGEGRRKRFIVLLSAILAFGGYLLFVVAFETRFPFGPVENLLKGVF